MYNKFRLTTTRLVIVRKLILHLTVEDGRAVCNEVNRGIIFSRKMEI